MGRLTTRRDDNMATTPQKAYEEYAEQEPIDCIAFCKTQDDCMTCPIGACFDKLADYEDLEEQNRLIVLQCAPGTTVYRPNKKTGEIEEEYLGGISKILEYSGQFGDYVFLTREEAEDRLNGVAYKTN